MKTNEAVRDRILRLCQEHDMTINRLATVSALPPSSIKNILYGKSRNPKLLTIKLICDGLGITLGQFFTAPEFDNLSRSWNKIRRMSSAGRVNPGGFGRGTRAPPYKACVDRISCRAGPMCPAAEERDGFRKPPVGPAAPGGPRPRK